MSTDWCLIESDPGVFSELVEKVGVQGVLFDEVWDLDLLKTEPNKDIYGLIFLFKCNDAPENMNAELNDRIPLSPPDGLFFAKQVIQNACATQAILSVLLNNDQKLNIGKELKEFKSFTQAFDPAMRGLAISNQETLRKVHNSFARESSFDFVDDDKSKNKEDSFHFVAFVNHKGKVYELDGLREGAMLVGAVESGKDWLDVVRPELQGRMERFQAGKSEIRFNLLSISQDPAAGPEKEILKLNFLQQNITLKIISSDFPEVEVVDEDSVNSDITSESDPEKKKHHIDFISLDLDDVLDDSQQPDGVKSFEELSDKLTDLKTEYRSASKSIRDLKESIKSSLEKKAVWKKENERRRHDYTPFVLCCLKHLAMNGALTPAYNAAKEKAIAAKQAETVGEKVKVEKSG